MRYQVPQFIEVEDKIFGPFTLKQFIYLAGGGGLCLIFFTLLPMWAAIALAVPAVAFSGSLAFYQVNGRPLILALEHGFSYFIGKKLYLWKQRKALPAQETTQTATSQTPSTMTMTVPKLSESKLKDLAWSLNIKDRSPGGGAQTKQGGRDNFAV